MKRPLKGFAFLLIPLFGMITPLLALPAITTRFGAEGWAAVAIGQSIGAAAATLVELGWGLNGPQRVARMSTTSTYRSAVLSLQTKGLMLVPMAMVAFTASWLLAPSHRLDAAIVAAGTAATALSLSWLFLGKTAPLRIIGTDSVIRLGGIALATALLLVGGDLWVYAVVGIAFPAFASPALACLLVRRAARRRVPIPSLRLVKYSMRAQWHAVTARGVSALYIALPVALVGVVSPASVAVFAAGERLMRLGLAAMAVVPSAMQGWVGSALNREQRMGRVRLAILMNAGLGVVAALVFGFFGPFASQLVFSGSATIPPMFAWTLAGVVILVSVSRATGGIGLVALQRVDVIARSATAGAIVGVPTLLLGGLMLGPVGGALGELAAEGTVLAVQARGLRGILPRGRG